MILGVKYSVLFSIFLFSFSNQTTKKELLPVFVFVHGGSNIVGMAALHDGDVFAAYTEVIVVMMNYRLAALGMWVNFNFIFLNVFS